MQYLLSTKEGLGKLILSVASEFGYTPKFDYSGRGLYRDKCFGMIGDIENLGVFFVNVSVLCHKAGIDVSKLNDCFIYTY